jgi:hypothetical protein
MCPESLQNGPSRGLETRLYLLSPLAIKPLPRSKTLHSIL